MLWWILVLILRGGFPYLNYEFLDSFYYESFNNHVFCSQNKHQFFCREVSFCFIKEKISIIEDRLEILLDLELFICDDSIFPGRMKEILLSGICPLST